MLCKVQHQWNSLNGVKHYRKQCHKEKILNCECHSPSTSLHVYTLHDERAPTSEDFPPIDMSQKTVGVFWVEWRNWRQKSTSRNLFPTGVMLQVEENYRNTSMLQRMSPKCPLLSGVPCHSVLAQGTRKWGRNPPGFFWMIVLIQLGRRITRYRKTQHPVTCNVSWGTWMNREVNWHVTLQVNWHVTSQVRWRVTCMWELLTWSSYSFIGSYKKWRNFHRKRDTG